MVHHEVLNKLNPFLSASSVGDIIKDDLNVGAHFLTPAQLAVVYRSDPRRGLTEAVAKDLYAVHGPNKLKGVQGDTYFHLFRRNLFGWFQCVLWIGAILNFIAYLTADMIADSNHTKSEYLYLGCVITATIVGTGLFGFYVEAKNMSVMSGFEKLVPPNATVIREKVKRTIPNTEIVLGDIVEITSGEVVPADVRILRCSNFKTDMSSITGESEPVRHQPECTNKNHLESKNMAFFSSPVTEGTARAMVIATGEDTEIGKIASLVTGLRKDETPIAKEIKHFIKLICYVAFVFGILFFIMVYIIQGNWVIALQYMLGIILANVPEGLLVTLTVCFTLSAKQLKKKNCLAKSLQAVETLGSVSVICTDKTGTLTENKMKVAHLYCNHEIMDKNDQSHITEPSYQDLTLAASLNLRATFYSEDEGTPIMQRKVMGDASEGAILRYMEEHRSATKTRNAYPKVAEIPFSSAFKYQISIHQIPSSGNYLLIMKGAPEILINYCITWRTNEGEPTITAAMKKEIHENFIKLANMGERIIGYADLYLPPATYPQGYAFDTQNENFPKEGLRFLGAVALIDPPRDNIEKYIDLCREAGIKVVMVTGDHPVTALAIARQCHIITKKTQFDYAFEHKMDTEDVPKTIYKSLKAAVITGAGLHTMSNRDIEKCIMRYDEIVFARTSPQQKLFIVENYQRLEYVVAVTGDGVNDAPALKKANIGIAMGITGTEVSKQAADMILMDDNFSSIVLGIEEGRRIFDNLKKTIAYTLTSNTPEMLPFVMYATLGIPLPLTLILILVINVGTDLLPAISLAYESSEEDIMAIPPRKPTDRLVTRVLLFMAYFQVGVIQFFAGMYAYYITFATEAWFPMTLMNIRNQWDSSIVQVQDSIGRNWSFAERKRLEKKAQTSYFVAICMTQISDSIICKTRRISLIKKGMRNHVLNISIVVNIIAATGVTYIPICNMVFGTEALNWYDFLLSIPFMILMILTDELRRYFIRNNYSKWLEEETYY